MKYNPPAASAEAEQAMQKILQAEREAEQAITGCENKAQQIIHDAQVKAQRINTRANERITNMEMRHGHKLNQLINDIDKEAALALKHETGQCGDHEHLRSIVQQLAIELCSGETSSGCNTA